MKDRPHDDAMAEVYRNDPALAAAVLAAVEADGDSAELAIVRRQLAMAASTRPLTPAEIEALRQDMGQAIEWARAELARRRNMKK
ncbi:hypothetical protein HUS70_21840 [Pandoraea nosoerga]|uniref:hypothetical protein n=1 Tax=Pandoraea nosoerga TaxID=2508296 RepID=UPI001EC42F17|nr:hypothetical protein [Pandoraea nosoerga]MBN4668200.1 hypothetical protein [Pandoraea nosoerga]MBN4678083.1 hypothetical protein [Pandoraea nosoerga]MBN4683289.1 hypothetical protein [Pandoraea nosoerga]MBN4747237.1 hypothetical protein [Pandoraea nosoerga]